MTRRVVTVLFADLIGSTSFGERVDAESAREALAEYHTMARDAIEANGGTVAKFIGDGVMALFGVPEIAEDDAGRAVTAGLALQRGFAQISERVAARHEVELGLRVGINTGELVLADGDTDVVGDAVNTAARLEAACAPGDVLVGEETWRLTRSHISYEVLGEVAVKGKYDPVATFRVADDGVAHDDPVTPFVGRVDELARLREVLGDAVEQLSARLATVIGAPGVGKTRIAREFADSLGDAATVVELRCERAGTATFAPIAGLLRAVTPIDDDADSDRVKAAMLSLVAELDDAERVADLLASFVGAAPIRSTEEAFLAVRRLVEAVGRRRPLVVVVDDIQWAEPLFLDLLEHLAEWVRDAPAFVIGLARPELRELRPSLAEEGRVLAASIGLEGLDAGATAELAARLVGTDSLPSELVARLPSSTEGNPFFVRELMRMLVDDGVIEETTAGWQLTIDADAVEVPPTIQSLLAARLDRIPVDERRLVELAAVVGPEFALGAVAAISEQGRADLRIAIERLRRNELVEPTGMYWGDEPIYRFHHVLIRDAAYRRLLKRARADLHLRVAEWTERTAADLPGEHEVTIAHHLEQAHEYHRQLDDVDASMTAVGRRAAELLGDAAERSLNRDDLPAASAQAERALARLDVGDSMIPPLLVVAAEALLGLSDVGRGRPIVEHLAEVVGDDERLAPWAESFEAQVTMLTEPDRLHEADEQADRAAMRLAELGDETGVAKARLVRAGVLARLGRVGQCEVELDLALTAARSAGDRRRVAAVLGTAPVAALWGPSPIPRAGGRCLDVIRLLRITTGSPAVEATSMRCQAVLEALRGRFDTARSMLADSRATVEELGLRHGVAETDLYTGIVELLAGEPLAAEPPLRDAYHDLDRLGIDADAGQAAAYLAQALLRQGHLDEADELAARSAELAGENPQTAIAARTAQAQILAAQGRHHDAVAVAQEAVARAEGTDIIVDHAAASAVLAQVAELAGDAATAEQASRAAAELYEQKAATIRVETTASTVAAGATRDAVAGAEGRVPGSGPWNRADERARRLMGLFVDRSSDAWLEMIDPAVVAHDRQALVKTTLRGRDAYRKGFPRDIGDAEFEARIEPVAVRGDDLALHRLDLWLSDGHAEWHQLRLTRWNAADRIDFACVYEPDDLAVAIAELDQLYRDELGDSSAVEHDPWNAADRLTRRFVELFTAGARERWLPMLSPDQETIDRRPLVGVDTIRIDGVADAHPRDRRTRALSSTVETVAVRGESFALARWRATSNSGREWDSLFLTRWTSDGLNDLNVIFPPDQLSDAVAELDRLHLKELGDSIEALHFREYERAMALLGTGDVDGFIDLHDPSFVMRDHRRLGWAEPTLEEYRARMDSLAEVDADALVFQERLLRLDHTSSTCMAQRIVFTTPGGPQQISRGVLVMIVDPHTGLITLMEQFEEDQVDEAVARFDELMAERGPVLHNEASQRAFFINGWLRRGDDELVAGAVAAEATLIDEQGEPFELTTAGRREVMAVRGERLAMVVVGSPGHSVQVEETDELGRLASVRRFGTSDLTDAVAHLHQRFPQIDGEPTTEVEAWASGFVIAVSLGDREWFEARLAPEFELVDHRPLGFGRFDRLAACDLYMAGATNDEDNGALVVRTVHAVGERARVASSSVVTIGPEGTLAVGVEVLSLFEISNGRAVRNEWFAHDDLDSAMRRFEEIEHRRVATNEPWNEADRLTQAFFDWMMDPARDDWSALVAADHLEDDRRAVVGGGRINRDEYVQLWSGQQASPGYDLTLETIATRGERLVLYRLAMVNDGLMTEFLQIDRWNEAGLIDRQIRIDHGDLEAAMTELDRLWATSLTERRQSASRLAVALGRAWVAPSTHTFDDLLTGDFEFVDGRTLGMGSLDRADFEQILRGREADGATGVPVPSRVEFVSDDVMVFRANNLGQAQDSGVDWEEIACNVLVFDDDRITRLEMFDEDHWDDAVARAKELSCPVRRPENPAARHRDVHITDVGGHDAVVDGDLFEDRRSVVSDEDGPTDLNATAGRIGEFAGGEPATALPVPDAQRLGQRVVDRIGTGDFEAARDCFEEGFLRIDQRRVIGLPDMDRDAYVDDLHRQWELGWQDFRTVGQIAVRDNAFSALLTTDFDGGSESPFRVLVVEGATGRIGRLVMYDEHDTQSADSDLDEAWLATLDPADAATYRIATAQYRAYVELDREQLDELTAEDHVFVDHRRLGNFGKLDRDGFFAMFDTRRDTRGAGIARSIAVHRLAGGVLVWSTEERTSGDAPRGDVAGTGVFLARVVDGRTVRAEIWDHDHVERALARAEELETAATSSGRAGELAPEPGDSPEA